MPIDSDEIPEYSGNVRLIDRQSGITRFEGTLENGRIMGSGVVYDELGGVVYNGNFQMEAFDGYGELYYSGGAIQYMGNFAMNSYDGTGTLFYKNGEKMYEGEFTSGLYNGNGTLYYANGEKMYELIRLTYIEPEKLSHAELLLRLDISSRHYYRLRQQAINILSIRLWSTPVAEMDSWLEVLTLLEELG